MTGLVQIPLDGGATLLVRVDDDHLDRRLARHGTVRSARVGDRIGLTAAIATQSLREALTPVAQMSQQVVAQLAQSGPQELQLEFGVELTTETGAVLAKAGDGSHLTVTVTWAAGAATGSSEHTSPAEPTSAPPPAADTEPVTDTEPATEPERVAHSGPQPRPTVTGVPGSEPIPEPGARPVTRNGTGPANRTDPTSADA